MHDQHSRFAAPAAAFRSGIAIARNCRAVRAGAPGFKAAHAILARRQRRWRKTGCCSTPRRTCASRSRRRRVSHPPPSGAMRASPIQRGRADQWRRRPCRRAAQRCASASRSTSMASRRVLADAARQPHLRHSRARHRRRAANCRSAPRRRSKAPARRSGSRSRPSRCPARSRSISRTPSAEGFGTRERRHARAAHRARPRPARRSSIFPAAPRLDAASPKRLRGAELVFFDGTLWQ